MTMTKETREERLARKAEMVKRALADPEALFVDSKGRMMRQKDSPGWKPPKDVPAVVVETPTGHNLIKACAEDIIKSLKAENFEVFDRAFFIGEKLSSIYNACRSKNCGYEGKTLNHRYSKALHDEILMRHDRAALNFNDRILRYYKQAFETFGKNRDELRGKVSFDKLKLLLPAKFDKVRSSIVDDLVNGQPVDWSETLGTKKKAKKPKEKAPPSIDATVAELKSEYSPDQLVKIAKMLLEGIKA